MEILYLKHNYIMKPNNMTLLAYSLQMCAFCKMIIL